LGHTMAMVRISPVCSEDVPYLTLFKTSFGTSKRDRFIFPTFDWLGNPIHSVPFSPVPGSSDIQPNSHSRVSQIKNSKFTQRIMKLRSAKPIRSPVNTITCRLPNAIDSALSTSDNLSRLLHVFLGNTGVTDVISRKNAWRPWSLAERRCPRPIFTHKTCRLIAWQE
jgi:hypothetical protein